MIFLNQHHSHLSDKYTVEASVNIDQDRLKIHFNVTLPELTTNSEFSLDGVSNMGLWEYDVCEAFIHRYKDKGPYLEVQVSPLNQKLALNIVKPREQVESISKLDFQSKTQNTVTGFEVFMDIAITEIPGDTDIISGGLFACLGPKERRVYFSLNPNLEPEPDFHRPELFYIDLVSLSQRNTK